MGQVTQADLPHMADVRTWMLGDYHSMTQISTHETHQHENFERAEALWDAIRREDYGPVFDDFTDDLIMVNGPGAGPWHIARGKDDVALLQIEFASALEGTFRQDGRCVYADDRVSISLVHETGLAPSGDVFDNMAVYVSRMRSDGKTERIWTVDLDSEHCEEFWQRNEGKPSKDFS